MAKENSDGSITKSLEMCAKCGISEPHDKLHDGICKECINDKKYGRTPHTKENPYLALGFFEFAILSTLMVLFFPWSLLVCVIFFGLEETKFIIIALLHDFFMTLIAIISIVVPILVVLFIIIYFLIF